MASTIGIKIANGDFFSIAEENSNVKKRLILTTVHDNQDSLQIDLYRSRMHTMADAQYIGTIVVENVNPRPKGEPSIELIISSNEMGEVSADATDLDASINAEHQHLSASLKSLDIDSRDYDIPDFELEQHEPPPQGLYEKASQIRKKQGWRQKQSFPWIALIIIGILLLLAGLGIWFFLFRNNQAAPKPRSAPAVEKPVQAPEPEPPPVEEPPKPVPVISAQEPLAPEPAAEPVSPPKPLPAAAPSQPRARGDRPSAPVSSYKAPPVIPKGGVPYKIRWGDTLWDISEAFYRNPWLYTRIARYNNIRNPDLIISGSTIRIPPKN
ncbi:MAG: LysM peptidoglycan-binding domain-containing protein [Treponema sp.]|jgi:hypothetical protein|nr:LysM peptidoglycan-binding domain-containing protein [Treponema sp.]